MAQRIPYRVVISSRAMKDLRGIQRQIAEHILDRIEALQDGMEGDVRKLSGTENRYRLRVGDYRVLFERVDTEITVYRIRHRREVYQ